MIERYRATSIAVRGMFVWDNQEERHPQAIELAKRLNELTAERDALLKERKEIADAVEGTRRYAIEHNSTIGGECVAWRRLKALATAIKATGTAVEGGNQ